MPPTPQPTTPNPLIMVVWLSVPTRRIGDGDVPGVILSDENALRKKLEIHLVDDADVGWHGAKIVKRLLTPAEEFVALAVAAEFQVHVQLQGIARAEAVDLHGVVDHQVDWDQWIDLPRIAPEPLHRAAHRRQIDNGRDAGEILQHDARRHERDLGFRGSRRVPGSQTANILLGHDIPVACPQHGFQQISDRVGQGGDVPQSLIFQPRQSINSHGPAARLEGVSRGKRIVLGSLDIHGDHSPVSLMRQANSCAMLHSRKFTRRCLLEVRLLRSQRRLVTLTDDIRSRQVSTSLLCLRPDSPPANAPPVA